MAVGKEGGALKYVALRARNEFMPFDPDPANRYHEPYGRVAFARRGLQRTRWRRGSRTEGGRCRASDPAGWCAIRCNTRQPAERKPIWKCGICNPEQTPTTHELSLVAGAGVSGSSPLVGSHTGTRRTSSVPFFTRVLPAEVLIRPGTYWPTSKNTSTTILSPICRLWYS